MLRRATEPTKACGALDVDDENSGPLLNWGATGDENEELYCLLKEDCARFLRHAQREGAASAADDGDDSVDSHAEMEIERLLTEHYGYGASGAASEVRGINLRQFQRALLSCCRNSWVSPREASVHHDMTQPLTHYFISSSHNTYLCGNQLTGASSPDMYALALLNGCRSVELDCFDGADGKPDVTHGKTLTTRVKFEDCCLAIRDCAFVTSPYPVTLSLEVHASVEQQREMVKIMRRCFGDSLTDCSLSMGSTFGDATFTPEALRGKILVKSKRKKRDANGSINNTLSSVGGVGAFGLVDSDPDTDDEKDGSGGAKKKAAVTAAIGDGPDGILHASTKISQELSDVTFMPAVKFQSLEHLATLPHYGVSSIEETVTQQWAKGCAIIAVNRSSGALVATSSSLASSSKNAKGSSGSLLLLGSSAADVSAFGSFLQNDETKSAAPAHGLSRTGQLAVDSAKRYMLRVYPSGTRFQSGNMDPQPSWNVGAQMVAINIQTPDRGHRLSFHRFRYANANCGYLLKPLAMRTERSAPCAFRDDLILSITILCGFSLPRSDGGSGGGRGGGAIADPCVEVFMRGFGNDDSLLSNGLAGGGAAGGGETPRTEPDAEFVNWKGPTPSNEVANNKAAAVVAAVESMALASASSFALTDRAGAGRNNNPSTNGSVLKRIADPLAFARYRNQCHTTRTISDNGFKPSWATAASSASTNAAAVGGNKFASKVNPSSTAALSAPQRQQQQRVEGETFHFAVRAVELATLCVRVLDRRRSGAALIGEAAVPAASVREGYRRVTLYDSSGRELPNPTCLFVHIRWENPLFVEEKARGEGTEGGGGGARILSAARRHEACQTTGRSAAEDHRRRNFNATNPSAAAHHRNAQQHAMGGGGASPLSALYSAPSVGDINAGDLAML